VHAGAGTAAGVVIVAPASRSTCSAPDCIAREYTWREAGVTTMRTPEAMRLPFRMAAAASRSSSRPLVQVPRKAWWMRVPANCAAGCTLSTLLGAETSGSTITKSKLCCAR
jgi:hypothetical protein